MHKSLDFTLDLWVRDQCDYTLRTFKDIYRVIKKKGAKF